jgi:hypothetical protein
VVTNTGGPSVTTALNLAREIECRLEQTRRVRNWTWSRRF